MVVKKNLTADELVGSLKTDSASAQNNFDGFVDNRVIPDAGVPTQYMEGILDVSQEGHGYLRPSFSPSEKDVYISSSQIRRFYLRPGDMVGGQVRAPKEKERYYGLLKVEKVNDIDIDKLGQRPNFDNLTPVYPDEQIKLETGKTPLSTRVIDLISPIGKGQRGLIVSPPKAGKTWLLKDIANGISTNYKDIHLMAVLVGERPEEVTDISRSVKGEVIASNFDEPPEHQTRVAEIALERAKRLVEMGKNVFILLDSITRLARAYNLSIPTSGRTLTGGFDPAALYPAKHFLGAARKIEKDGSLTIIGTTLIETGSKMDDLIYEEFKGTGNMELHLTRSLAERRVYPAIDIQRSGTRQEELLYDKKDYPKIVTVRKMVDMLGADERTEIILERLARTKNNEEFLKTLGQG
ncbi:transcription termination factor Rho [Candidatus Woesebacteria bacterium CG_4_10_14_0_2_um_filter_39_14]|uniref:Transcription termination factor Rho n=4 Tax=Microgenomates group TaxID=1794810 RepID=A0A2M7XLA7_9BACT|nr:MAG: transcription termination factor Rho [Candidatus Woesebacteria bacterium CG_4_10_14_0_2_um_filter_39_14]PJA49365.1 MAG: transcription termination factor Rho [Candidatus Shapirobacteria bacterium CG_4_9_14_3_um_filter_39_13]